MIENFNIAHTYHLKDVFFSAEILIGCSVLQLTFYVIGVSYVRRNGFVILNQQIYYVGFLILFCASTLIFNEELLFQNFSSINDYLSFFSKFVICVTSLFFILVITVFSKEELMKHNFEYVVLILIGVLGSLLLCSSNDLLTAYLSMELQSIAFYIMAAFKKNSNYSVESGLKYFIIGSFASALFLFGSSFLYGYTGSLNFNDFKFFLNITQNNVSDFGGVPLIYYFLNFLITNIFINVNDFNLVIDPNCLLDLDGILSTTIKDYSTLSDIFENGFYSDKSICIDYPEWFLLENHIALADTASTFHSKTIFHKILPTLNGYSEDRIYPMFHNVSVMFGFDSLDHLYYSSEFLVSKFLYSSAPYYEFNFEVNTSTLIYSKIMSEFCLSGESVYDPRFFFDNSYFDTQIIYIGFMLVCLSLLIKLAVAPFHFWSLDVYEGSPNASTFFFAVIPKIGLFVLLTRICYSGFYELLDEWRFYFLILAVTSIFVGSLGGLEQRKLKSLLAYSSISHTGYLLLAFSTNITEGIPVMIYYIVIYMISGLCFWSIYMFLKLKIKTSYYNKQNKELGDLVLLFKSNPVLAISLTITLFSIAGIPPLVGFLAKFNIFLSVLTVSAYIIALVSILLSVISTFYYIRVIKIIYFENMLTGKLYHSISTNKALIISLLFLAIILLSIYPTVLYITAYKAMLLF